MTVLIIDDEDMILNLAGKILSRAGHESVTARTGEEGLEHLSRDPAAIDLVIVDYSLSGLSGLELMTALRDTAPRKPLVISSGQRIDADSIPPDLAKGTSFLQKPYRAADLVETVEEAIATASDN